MNKPVKIILSIFATSVMVVIITTASLIFIIDVNDFKSEIETSVEKHLSRDLEITGNIDISLFPWIGLTTGKMRLYNDKSFKNRLFAEIDSSKLSVKLLPLLSNQLEVNEITLDGVKLNLIINSQGQNNWDDLVVSDKKDSTNKQTSPLALLTIAGIEIKNSEILWQDLQQDKRVEIKKLNFQLGRISFDEEIPMAASLEIANSEPKFKQIVKLSSQLLLTQKFDIFEFNETTLELDTQSELLPTTPLKSTLQTNIQFDSQQKRLNLSALKMSVHQLKLDGQVVSHFSPFSLQANINIAELNLEKFMQQLEIELPQMADNRALQYFSMQFDLNANEKETQFNNLFITLDETTLKGETKIENYQQPSVNFTASLDRLNLDRYLPLSSTRENEKTTSDNPAKDVVTSANKLPIETLRKLNATGKVKIKELKVKNLKMEGIEFLLSAKDGILESKQQINQFYNGEYSGLLKLNLRSQPPVLNSNNNFQHLKIESLLKDIKDDSKLAGNLSLTTNLSAKGQNIKEVKSSLNGNMSLLLEKATIRGFDLPLLLQQGQTLLQTAKLPTLNLSKQSFFTKITATAHIKKGVLKNKDLLALSPKIQAKGQGRINLVSEKINYKIKAKYVAKQSENDLLKDLNDMPIFVSISGDLQQPAYDLDLAAMLAEKNKDKIEKLTDEVLEKIDTKIVPVVNTFIEGLLN